MIDRMLSVPAPWDYGKRFYMDRTGRITTNVRTEINPNRGLHSERSNTRQHPDLIIYETIACNIVSYKMNHNVALLINSYKVVR